MGRFIDNVHMTIQFNLLFKFIKEYPKLIDRKYCPIGGDEFAKDVRGWMEESYELRFKRDRLTRDLSKIEECFAIIGNLSKTTT